MRSRAMTEPARLQTVLAYWLLPASAAREFFAKPSLASPRSTTPPLFEPHVTLAVGADSETEANRILTGVAIGQIELESAGIHFTAKFTKTLFVRFKSTRSLEQLRNSLGLEPRNDDPFDPHVSLLYQKIPVAEQARLAAAVKLPFQTVRFDALQVVRCRVPVATAADVAAWEIVGSRRFGN